METLTATEQQTISKLFNGGGGVFNFSVDRFNAFTETSIGIPLYDYYPGLSKGKSLEEFLKTASISLATKLLEDLLESYKLCCEEQKKDDWENDTLYKRCLEIIKKYKTENPFIENSMQTLNEKFNDDNIKKRDCYLKIFLLYCS